MGGVPLYQALLFAALTCLLGALFTSLWEWRKSKAGRELAALVRQIDETHKRDELLKLSPPLLPFHPLLDGLVAKIIMRTHDDPSQYEELYVILRTQGRAELILLAQMHERGLREHNAERRAWNRPAVAQGRCCG